MEKNKYYIYVLWSERLKKRYVGSTENVEKRFEQHNKGRSHFTKRGVPWILLLQEEFSSKKEAIKRENFLKQGVGQKFLDEMFH
jgi:putative endonuclease